jgi:dihydropteroate synthase
VKDMVRDILSSNGSGNFYVMGILNVTPDSFSDGGKYFSVDSALSKATEMIRDGAAIIDIGAESTKLGSDRVNAEEQIKRLTKILPAVVATGAAVSVDTTLSEVALFAIECGADIINDISAGTDDPKMLPLLAKHKIPAVLMHMPAQPKVMQHQPHYDNVVNEVAMYLEGQLNAAIEAGLPAELCIIDPGIGFGKLPEHNLQLLRGTPRLMELGRPVLIGASRKNFIGIITAQNLPEDRLSGTIAACCETYRLGASIFRVHDVRPVIDALKMTAAILGRNSVST